MKIVRRLFHDPQTALFSIFLGLFSLGQLQRIQLTQQIAFYLHDLVIIIFLMINLFKIKNKLNLKKINLFLKKIKKKYALELAWIIWLTGGILAGWLAQRFTLQSSLYLIRIIVYASFVFSLLKLQFFYSKQEGWAFIGLLMAVWGIFQYLLIPDTRFLTVFGWDNHYFRLIGTLFDPAFMGMLLILGFGWWQSPQIFPFMANKWKKFIQLIFVVTIVATFSRASYFALFLLLGMLLILKQIKVKSLIIILAIFTATLFLLPKPGGEGVNLARTSTTEARTRNVQEGLGSLQGWELLWGRGLFNEKSTQIYQTPDHAQLPDSLPVMLINASGLGGLILASLVLYKWLSKWWRADPIWTSLLITTLVHSLFNNTFLQPFIFLALWGSKKNNHALKKS